MRPEKFEVDGWEVTSAGNDTLFNSNREDHMCDDGVSSWKSGSHASIASTTLDSSASSSSSWGTIDGTSKAGVGIIVGVRACGLVVESLAHSIIPAAEQDKIHIGDIIESIDGARVVGLRIRDVIPLLQGDPLTMVTLGVLRGSERMFVTLTRGLCPAPDNRGSRTHRASSPACTTTLSPFPCTSSDHRRQSGSLEISDKLRRTPSAVAFPSHRGDLDARAWASPLTVHSPVYGSATGYRHHEIERQSQSSSSGIAPFKQGRHIAGQSPHDAGRRNSSASLHDNGHRVRSTTTSFSKRSATGSSSTPTTPRKDLNTEPHMAGAETTSFSKRSAPHSFSTPSTPRKDLKTEPSAAEAERMSDTHFSSGVHNSFREARIADDRQASVLALASNPHRAQTALEELLEEVRNRQHESIILQRQIRELTHRLDEGEGQGAAGREALEAEVCELRELVMGLKGELEWAEGGGRDEKAAELRGALIQIDDISARLEAARAREEDLEKRLGAATQRNQELEEEAQLLKEQLATGPRRGSECSVGTPLCAPGRASVDQVSPSPSPVTVGAIRKLEDMVETLLTVSEQEQLQRNKDLHEEHSSLQDLLYVLQGAEKAKIRLELERQHERCAIDMERSQWEEERRQWGVERHMWGQERDAWEMVKTAWGREWEEERRTFAMEQEAIMAERQERGAERMAWEQERKAWEDERCLQDKERKGWEALKDAWEAEKEILRSENKALEKTCAEIEAELLRTRKQRNTERDAEAMLKLEPIAQAADSLTPASVLGQRVLCSGIFSSAQDLSAACNKLEAQAEALQNDTRPLQHDTISVLTTYVHAPPVAEQAVPPTAHHLPATRNAELTVQTDVVELSAGEETWERARTQENEKVLDKSEEDGSKMAGKEEGKSRHMEGQDATSRVERERREEVEERDRKGAGKTSRRCVVDVMEHVGEIGHAEDGSVQVSTSQGDDAASVRTSQVLGRGSTKAQTRTVQQTLTPSYLPTQPSHNETKSKQYALQATPYLSLTPASATPKRPAVRGAWRGLSDSLWDGGANGSSSSYGTAIPSSDSNGLLAPVSEHTHPHTDSLPLAHHITYTRPVRNGTAHVLSTPQGTEYTSTPSRRYHENSQSSTSESKKGNPHAQTSLEPSSAFSTEYSTRTPQKIQTASPFSMRRAYLWEEDDESAGQTRIKQTPNGIIANSQRRASFDFADTDMQREQDENASPQRDHEDILQHGGDPVATPRLRSTWGSSVDGFLEPSKHNESLNLSSVTTPHTFVQGPTSDTLPASSDRSSNQNGSDQATPLMSVGYSISPQAPQRLNWWSREQKDPHVDGGVNKMQHESDNKYRNAPISAAPTSPQVPRRLHSLQGVSRSPSSSDASNMRRKSKMSWPSPRWVRSAVPAKTENLL